MQSQRLDNKTWMSRRNLKECRQKNKKTGFFQSRSRSSRHFGLVLKDDKKAFVQTIRASINCATFDRKTEASKDGHN